MRQRDLFRFIVCSISAGVVLSLWATAVHCQIIVNELFDGYADDAAFESVWTPTGNTGAPYAGILVPRTVAPFPPPPFDGTGDNGVTPPVPPVVGKAIAFDDLNGINAYSGSSFSLCAQCHSSCAIDGRHV